MTTRSLSARVTPFQVARAVRISVLLLAAAGEPAPDRLASPSTWIGPRPRTLQGKCRRADTPAPPWAPPVGRQGGRDLSGDRRPAARAPSGPGSARCGSLA